MKPQGGLCLPEDKSAAGREAQRASSRFFLQYIVGMPEESLRDNAFSRTGQSKIDFTVIRRVLHLAGLINELLDTLKSQTKSYDELLVLSREKRRVIIENDVDMLGKITQAENSIIGQTQKTESRRLEIMGDIATVLGQNVDDLTLNRLCELIEGQDEHGELLTLGKNLKSILDELKEENDRNTVLIQSSLDYIDFTVNLVRQSATASEPYINQRKSVPGTDKGFFDKSR